MGEMFSALVILVSLILATPITIIFDGPMVIGLLASLATILLVIVGVAIRPPEAGFLSHVIGPMVLAAAFPAIWMLIQVIPLSTLEVAQPIWKSATAALGSPLSASISIDPGATLISFTHYLSTTAIAFVAAALAIDRRFAEWIFFTLTVAMIFIALMALAVGLGVFAFPSSAASGQSRIAAIACAALGIIFTAAAAINTFEQYKARQPAQAAPWTGLTFAAWIVGLIICSLTVIIDASGATYCAVIFGVATLIVVHIIRRFRLGPWGIAAIIAAIMFVVIAVVAIQPSIWVTDFTLAFATRASTPLIAVTQRILAETAWMGTGAGTFSAILPIYRDIDELATGHVAPTAAAAIAVEMGRPFFWAILIAAVTLAFSLVRGALGRRRDSYYSAAGASCVVTITLLLFANVGPLSTSVTLIGSVAIAVAVAQSKSRHA